MVPRGHPVGGDARRGWGPNPHGQLRAWAGKVAVPPAALDLGVPGCEVASRPLPSASCLACQECAPPQARSPHPGLSPGQTAPHCIDWPGQAEQASVSWE